MKIQIRVVGGGGIPITPMLPAKNDFSQIMKFLIRREAYDYNSYHTCLKKFPVHRIPNPGEGRGLV